MELVDRIRDFRSMWPALCDGVAALPPFTRFIAKTFVVIGFVFALLTYPFRAIGARVFPATERDVADAEESDAATEAEVRTMLPGVADVMFGKARPRDPAWFEDK
jgi:hypothetical protein